MQRSSADTPGTDTPQTYESPALVELGTLEELTLDAGEFTSEASGLGELLGRVSEVI